MKNKFPLIIAGILCLNAVLLIVLLTRPQPGSGPDSGAGDDGPPGRSPGNLGPGAFEALREMTSAKIGKADLPTPRQMVDDADGTIGDMIDEFAKQFNNTDDVREKLRIINELRRTPHARVVPVVRSMLADNESLIRGAALDALRGYTSAEAFAVAALASKDPDARVRQIAAMVMATARPADLADMVAPVLDLYTDPEEATRDQIKPVVPMLTYEERLEIISEALLSEYPDVINDATVQLQALSNQDAMEALIGGLNNTNPQLRADINDTIHHLIGVRFRDTESGLAYWEKNQARYDDRLLERLDQ